MLPAASDVGRMASQQPKRFHSVQAHTCNPTDHRHNTQLSLQHTFSPSAAHLGTAKSSQPKSGGIN